MKGQLPAPLGQDAGKRCQQPGTPAEQRREVKPAWVRRGHQTSETVFYCFAFEAAGRDWELIALVRSH